jgi:tight adherence protein B
VGIGSSETVLIAFGSIGLIVFAVSMVLRDILAPRTAGAGAALGPRRLRRAPDVYDKPAGKGLFGKVDVGFDRLVIETGQDLTPGLAFMLLVVCSLACGGGAWLYFDEPLLGIGGGLAGLLLPLCVMAVRRARRMQQIREQLPHVLDMLARGTRAGQSVEQAVQMIADEAGGVLGPEFARCAKQLDMGRAFDKVVHTLAMRIRMVEMRILATTLIVQRQTGGRLSETLERMSSVVRDRLSAQRQIKASTGAGRSSTLIIAAVGPIAWITIFMFHRPHVQVLLDDPLGRLLFITAIVLELVGLVWVFALLRREE